MVYINEANDRGMTMFLKVLIVFIVIVIIILVVFYMMRRRADKLIEALEIRKKVLFDRPVIDKLNSVKKIALSGETKEAFEGERQRWEHLIDKNLPKVEELLHEMEQDNEMFRITSVKPTALETERLLDSMEKEIDTITKNLDRLTKHHAEVERSLEEADDKLIESRKVLLTQAYTFGSQIERLESEEKRLREEITQANEQYNMGDFLEYYRNKDTIEAHITSLETQIKEIPPLLQKLNHELPNEFVQLSRGYNGMKAQGYSLNLINCDQAIESFKEELKGVESLVSSGDNQEATLEIERITEKVNSLYDQLEAEAVARQFVENEQLETEHQLKMEQDAVEMLYSEAKTVSEKYELSEETAAKPASMRKNLKRAEQNYEQAKIAFSEGTVDHSSIAELIVALQETIAENKVLQQEYSEQLKKIRKDELAAKAKANSYIDSLLKLESYIQRCRIPGVPTDLKESIEEAYISVGSLNASLEETPINVSAMNSLWNEAANRVDGVESGIYEMVENARLVEGVIQYANRYRFKNQELAMQLQVAEGYYDDEHDYNKALEIAAKSLEKVEAGAVKRVEEQLANTNYHY